jgi:hypothetical protein
MKNISGSSKMGRCSISVDKPISHIDQIEELEKALAKQFGLKWCLITNWRRFEEAE